MRLYVFLGCLLLAAGAWTSARAQETTTRETGANEGSGGTPTDSDETGPRDGPTGEGALLGDQTGDLDEEWVTIREHSVVVTDDDGQVWLAYDGPDGPVPIVAFQPAPPAPCVALDMNPARAYWVFSGATPEEELRLGIWADGAFILSSPQPGNCWHETPLGPASDEERFASILIEFTLSQGDLDLPEALPLPVQEFAMAGVEQILVGENGFRIEGDAGVLAQWRADPSVPDITRGLQAWQSGVAPGFPEGATEVMVDLITIGTDDGQGLFLHFAWSAAREADDESEYWYRAGEEGFFWPGSGDLVPLYSSTSTTTSTRGEQRSETQDDYETDITLTLGRGVLHYHQTEVTSSVYEDTCEQPDATPVCCMRSNQTMRQTVHITLDLPEATDIVLYDGPGLNLSWADPARCW